MSATDGDAFATGAAEAARLAREVQDLGFEAARTVVERFVEVFAQFATANGGAAPPRPGDDTGSSAGNGRGGGAGFGFWGSDRSMRTMQADMQRATDAYLSLLGQLNEASLRFFDVARWWPPAGGAAAARDERDELRLPDVAPGGRASARLWLHNTTATAAVDLRPWCPGLASHRGATLPGTAVTCAPERIDRLNPDASSALLVTVAVGDDAPAGDYHGLLLVDGLPDVVFPLRARVQRSASGS
jgi:hypothetical protein